MFADLQAVARDLEKKVEPAHHVPTVRLVDKAPPPLSRIRVTQVTDERNRANTDTPVKVGDRVNGCTVTRYDEETGTLYVNPPFDSDLTEERLGRSVVVPKGVRVPCVYDVLSLETPINLQDTIRDEDYHLGLHCSAYVVLTAQGYTVTH